MKIHVMTCMCFHLEFIYKRLLLPEQRQVELLKCQGENKVYVKGRQLLKADFHARQIKEVQKYVFYSFNPNFLSLPVIRIFRVPLTETPW